MAHAHALVEGLNKGFAAAFETRDFAPVAEMFTDDAVMLPPRRGLVRGRGDIQSYWSSAKRVKDLQFESETVTPLAGDVARDIGTLRMRIEPGRARRQSLAESGEGANHRRAKSPASTFSSGASLAATGSSKRASGTSPNSNAIAPVGRDAEAVGARANNPHRSLLHGNRFRGLGERSG